MSPMIIYSKKTRLIILALGAFAFVLIGISFLIFDLPYPNLVVNGIGIVSILFFGACFLFITKQVSKNKPALIINEEGIADYSSALKVGLVKWDEIEDIQFTTYMNQPFLSIYTFDKDLILNRTNSFQKMMTQMNKKLMDSQVNIVYKNLNCDPEKLTEAINYFWVLARKREDMSDFLPADANFKGYEKE